VVAEDVRRVLRAVVRPDDPDEGLAVQRLAERAETSTRTVYRCLNPKDREDGGPPTLKLDLADRLVMAAGRSLAEIGCRVVLPDGRTVEYGDA
jgi:hypothetical protein